MLTPRVLRHGLAVLSLSGLSATIGAASQTSASNPPAPPTANYTDHPRTETYHPAPTYSTSVYPSSVYPHPHPGSWTGRYPGDYSINSVTVRRPDMIFFPPAPPALGDPLPKPAPLTRNQPIPPPEMAGYVHEVFTAQIGTLIYHNDLPRKWRSLVEAYRADRDAAVDALRARIESTRMMDRAARSASLAAYAREQEATLADLEVEAERIRDLLTNGSFFTEGTNWNNTRRWRLGDDTQWESNAGGSRSAATTRSFRWTSIFPVSRSNPSRRQSWRSCCRFISRPERVACWGWPNTTSTPARSRRNSPRSTSASSGKPATLGIGATLITVVVAAGSHALRRAHRADAERNERLLRANFELTLAAKASAIGQITSHLLHGLQGPVAGLRAAMAPRRRGRTR